MTTRSTAREAPGVRQGFPARYGHVGRFQHDPVSFWMNGFRTHGDVFRFQVGPQSLFLLAHPDHVKHVLEERADSYPRGQFFEVFRAVLGENLLSTDGAFWHTRHRAVAPAVSPERWQVLQPFIEQVADEELQRLAANARRGEPFDVMGEFLEVHWRILWKFLADVDPGFGETRLRTSFTGVGVFLNWGCVRMVVPPIWIPTPRNIRLRRNLRVVDRAFYDVIAAHRADSTDRGDVLSALLQARDPETGQGLSDRQLRDELFGLLMPGWEPGALVWTWASYLLACNPGAGDRLRAELDTASDSSGSRATDALQLPYLGRVVRETIRLYPAIWLTIRVCQEDDEIGGFRIPRGSVVVLSPYVTHRHPAFWEAPEIFDPDRFLPARSGDRAPHAYLPWGLGEHECTGKRLGLFETPIVFARIQRHFRFRPLPGRPVQPEGRITVRPPNRRLLMTVEAC